MPPSLFAPSSIPAIRPPRQPRRKPCGPAPALDSSILCPPETQVDWVDGPAATGMPPAGLRLIGPETASGLLRASYRDEGNAVYRENAKDIADALASGGLAYSGATVILDGATPPNVLDGRKLLRGIVATGRPALCGFVTGVKRENLYAMDLFRARPGADVKLAAAAIREAGLRMPDETQAAALAAGQSFVWVELTVPMARAAIASRQRRGLPCRTAGAELLRDVAEGRYLPTGQPLRIRSDSVLADGARRCDAVVRTGRPIWITVAYGIDPRLPETAFDSTRPSSFAHHSQREHKKEPFDHQSGLRVICRLKGIERPTDVEMYRMRDTLDKFDETVVRMKARQRFLAQSVGVAASVHIAERRSPDAAWAYLDAILPTEAEFVGDFAGFKARTLRRLGPAQGRAARAVWRYIETHPPLRMSRLDRDEGVSVLVKAYRVFSGEGVRMRGPRTGPATLA